MKKWLYPAVALAAMAILARLPHPAKNIETLKPVRAVYLSMDGGEIQIETDTGDAGAGHSLTAATEDLCAGADGEIFLDTAQFLVLGPNVPIAEDFFAIFRLDCRVVHVDRKPDLETLADHLSIHKPKTTLNQLRAQKGAAHASKTAHTLAPGGPGRTAVPFLRLGLAE